MTRISLAIATALLLSSAPIQAGSWTVNIPHLTFPSQGGQITPADAGTTVSTRTAED